MDKRDTLLLTCGTTESRGTMRELMADSFNLLEADNTYQAVQLLEQNSGCVAAMLVDVTAPEKIDREVFAQAGKRGLWKQIPVIVIARESTARLFSLAFSLGVADVVPLNGDPHIIRRRIHNIVELYLYRQKLEDMLLEQAETIHQTNQRMVDALSSIIEHRSAESGQHILRIRRFTQLLLQEVARSCPEYELTEQTIRMISSAAALHDVGKISVPDAILNKPGRLTEEEREIMKTHAALGCEILESLNDVGNHEYLRYAHNICHYHHERWDGKGYPEGIAGDDIPICAQVVGLADVYDALTSERIYKAAYSCDTAVNMILSGECGVFSPKLLECFKQVSGQFEELARAYADGALPTAERFDVELPQPAAADGANSLEAVQTKYLALLHYMNAFVAEVDFDQNYHHLIYNPYPELSALRDAVGFEEVKRLVAEQVVVPEERERMRNLVEYGIPSFLEAGLRKQSYLFKVRSAKPGEHSVYEFSLLRPNMSDLTRQNLLCLWRKADAHGFDGAEIAETQRGIAFMDGFYCCRNDPGFTLSGTSSAISKLLGYTEDELRTLFGNRLIELVVPEERQAVRAAFTEQLSRSGDVELEYRVRHRSGKVLWILNKSRLLVGSDGVEYLNSVLTDITNSKRSHGQLQKKLDRYEIILAQTENVLFEWELAKDTITFSDTWEKIFGVPPIHGNVFEALRTAAYFHPDDAIKLERGIRELQTGAAYCMAEIRVVTAGGRYLWCRFRASAVRTADGALEKIVGVIINIDSEKREEQSLRDRAERDALTKLLNKAATVGKVGAYLEQRGKNACCAMLVIDLDNFKNVNDRYGHMFGDAVLTQAAREIKKQFRAQDIVGRIGGDEFMVVMCDVSDPGLVESRCAVLVDTFGDLFRDQVKDCGLGCSIGVAMAPEQGTSYNDLFQHADRALYQAKRSGKNVFVFYDGSSNIFSTWEKVDSALNSRIDSDEEPGLADHSFVQHAFRRLYLTEDMDQAINEMLAGIGKQMNVSRVYIFENSPDNRFCNNTYEWCNEGVEPQIHNLQGVSYAEDVPGYLDLYNEQGIFYCQDITALPREIYDVVAPQNIKSMLHCAIRDNGVFRGYIGFDECLTNRLWTGDQIESLSFFAEMLSVFLMKKRAQDEIAQRASDLISVLDNQNAWIYVIDPETCQLQFLNAKTKVLAPDVREGMYCYQGLMGRSERCPDCPAKDILKNKTACFRLVNRKFGLHIVSEATSIRWGGRDACLLTCREAEENR